MPKNNADYPQTRQYTCEAVSCRRDVPARWPTATQTVTFKDGTSVRYCARHQFRAPHDFTVTQEAR